MYHSPSALWTSPSPGRQEGEILGLRNRNHDSSLPCTERSRRKHSAVASRARGGAVQRRWCCSLRGWCRSREQSAERARFLFRSPSVYLTLGGASPPSARVCALAPRLCAAPRRQGGPCKERSRPQGTDLPNSPCWNHSTLKHRVTGALGDEGILFLSSSCKLWKDPTESHPLSLKF